MIDNNFIIIAKSIVNTKEYKPMKEYIQHGNVSCAKHCISVSYRSYILAKTLNKYLKLNLDEEAIIRAALLHDFFLYDWHYLPPEKNIFKMHGFTHPNVACNNAKKYFDINEKEQNIIENHMWPLTIYKLPKYKECFIIILIDKYCTIDEVIKNKLKRK